MKLTSSQVEALASRIEDLDIAQNAVHRKAAFEKFKKDPKIKKEVDATMKIIAQIAKDPILKSTLASGYNYNILSGLKDKTVIAQRSHIEEKYFNENYTTPSRKSRSQIQREILIASVDVKDLTELGNRLGYKI